MLKLSEIKKTKIIKGFTFGEMLLVMIIISLFVAVSTPIVTKRVKTTTSANTRKDIWNYTGDLDIYFPYKVVIGSDKISSKAQLHVYSADSSEPQIGLESNANKGVFSSYKDNIVLGSGTITANSYRSIVIGNASVGNQDAYIVDSIAIGPSATASGSFAVAIGENATASAVSSVAIGYNAVSAMGSRIALGSTSNDLYAPGLIATSSDLNLKNVKGFYKRGIKDLRNLNTYLFTFKTDENSIVRAGLIAQDVKKTIPEAITFSDEKGHLAIKNEYITFSMFNAITDIDKSLRTTVKKQFVLKHKVAKQEAEIRQLEKELEELSKS